MILVSSFSPDLLRVKSLGRVTERAVDRKNWPSWLLDGINHLNGKRRRQKCKGWQNCEGGISKFLPFLCRTKCFEINVVFKVPILDKELWVARAVRRRLGLDEVEDCVENEMEKLGWLDLDNQRGIQWPVRDPQRTTNERRGSEQHKEWLDEMNAEWTDIWKGKCRRFPRFPFPDSRRWGLGRSNPPPVRKSSLVGRRSKFNIHKWKGVAFGKLYC